MAAEQRKLLEQLMGASSSTKAAQLSLTDPKVCRSYVVGTCPHDLFTNTKQDIGPCMRVHNEALKTEYEGLNEREKQKLGFEYDYMRDLQKYIDGCNQRIDVAQRHLRKTAEEIRQTQELLKKISDLNESIKLGRMECEIAGQQGLVSLACDEFYRIKVKLQEKAAIEKELKELSENSGPSGHQKLQVCDVCGAYLSRLDNDRRLADHFYGKMHLGYAQMRKAYDAFPKEMRGRRAAPPVMDDHDGPSGPPPGPRGTRGGGGFRGRGRGGRPGW